MTQVLTTPFYGNWSSEVHFERNKSNWLESYPKSHHYSRKRQEPKIHPTPISDIFKKPLEEVKQILCDNPVAIGSQGITKYGQNEHNLRTKRIIKRPSTPENTQKITNYFVDRKFARPTLKTDRPVTGLINNNDSLNKCNPRKVVQSVDVPENKLDELAPSIPNESAKVVELEETRSVAENIAVPNWKVKVYSGKYIIEGTEDLSDNVFEERHLKHEISEKKRKKRDEKCFEEQERLGKLYKPTNTFNYPRKRVLQIEILQNEPRCAFGYVIPDVPCEDFDLPPEFFSFRRVRQCKPNKTDSTESENFDQSSVKLKRTRSSHSEGSQ